MRLLRNLPLLWVLLAPPAAAEIYRCVESDGAVRFVDDPSSCTQAERHEPTGALQVPASRPSTEVRPSSPDPTTLASLLPVAGEISHEWEITHEVAGSEVDPDQRGWGVLETQARHYGRTRAGVTQVCTIELWRMASAAKARDAADRLTRPGWQFKASGALLITLRGTRFERGKPFHKGLFPDCIALGSRVRAPSE